MVTAERFKPALNGFNDGKRKIGAIHHGGRVPRDLRPQGEANSNAELEEWQVRQMRVNWKKDRYMYRGKRSYAAAGRAFGVSMMTAKRVILKWTWRHVK